jgi:hypothetical protein
MKLEKKDKINGFSFYWNLGKVGVNPGSIKVLDILSDPSP